MVSFNCGKCGQCVRKNQVEKHLMSCRSNVFSCIDCSKDFYGQEYAAHLKCITEAEKYESKSYVAKANKGDLKQQTWHETVLNAIQNSNPSPKAKALLHKIQDYPNIPRKKPKFMNFVRNSFKTFGFNEQILEEVWKIIESFSAAQKPSQQQNEQKNLNGNGKRVVQEDNNSNENNSKKVKIDENIIDKNENEASLSDKFDWYEELKELFLGLDEACNKELSYKKIYKKLLKKYKLFMRIEEINEERFSKKLNKKLRKSCNTFELCEENDQINSIRLLV